MRNKPVLLLVLSGLALCCLPVAAHAQQAAQAAADKPVATIKVQAREVLLPVTVRDKRGALVPNLTVADFTLAEDGRPQVIKSFTRESNLPFRLGLLVDTSRSVSAAMENEKKAAEKRWLCSLTAKTVAARKTSTTQLTPRTTPIWPFTPSTSRASRNAAQVMAFLAAVAGAAGEAVGRVVAAVAEVIPVGAAVDTQAVVAAIPVEGVAGVAAIASRI